ncbi:MAG: hypothetical protein P0Y65_14345 [Candidatus Devosia phytovorans]|uniref:Uncharacterized protein n=1 Tax=Candidatus Devosia phytovorans TaxID=3121372 RepID=A0AAJ6B0B8_9HYPH|nr:hypothetical protein [Devosia sp.]WEK03368.1 MAG: hypothetical protein P0Y65_14345 [Devosia sp.]
MPVIDDQTKPIPPMTFRGADGRVYKTRQMEVDARGAAVNSIEASAKRSWLNILLRSPD